VRTSPGFGDTSFGAHSLYVEIDPVVVARTLLTIAYVTFALLTFDEL